MSKFQRVHITVSKEVPHAAADFWAAVRDWGDVASWWPGPDIAPFKLAGVDVKKSTSPTGLPLVRVVRPEKSGPNAAFLPDSIDETLIQADEDARVLAYQLQDALGMRNYLAYYEIDELGPKKARVTCTARFDVEGDAAAAAQAKGMIDNTFNNIIIGGVSAMLARRGK